MADSSCSQEHPVKPLLDALMGMWVDPELLDLIEAYTKLRRITVGFGRGIQRLRDLKQKDAEMGIDNESSEESKALHRIESRPALFTDNETIREFLLQEIKAKLQYCAAARQALCKGGGLILDAIHCPGSVIRTHEIMTQIENIENYFQAVGNNLSQLDSTIREDIPLQLYELNVWNLSIAQKLFAAVEMGNAGMLDSLADTLDRWREDEEDVLALKPWGNARCLKWKRARTVMHNYLNQGRLPGSLRDAATLLKTEGFGYGTIRKASHRSSRLKLHFKLGDDKPSDAESVLIELCELADQNTKRFIGTLDDHNRLDLAKRVNEMPPENALKLMIELGHDPDAGSTGDVMFIEGADQDSQEIQEGKGISNSDYIGDRDHDE